MSSLITLTVREILLPARVQMGVIEELQDRAMKQLGETSSQSEKLTTQFMEIEQASEMLRQKLVEASQTNLGFTDGLREQVADLSSVVSALSTQVNQLIANANKPEIKTDSELKPKIGRIEDGLKKSKVDIEEARRQQLKAMQKQLPSWMRRIIPENQR